MGFIDVHYGSVINGDADPFNRAALRWFLGGFHVDAFADIGGNTMVLAGDVIYGVVAFDLEFVFIVSVSLLQEYHIGVEFIC